MDNALFDKMLDVLKTAYDYLDDTITWSDETFSYHHEIWKVRDKIQEVLRITAAKKMLISEFEITTYDGRVTGYIFFDGYKFFRHWRQLDHFDVDEITEDQVNDYWKRETGEIT